jgi:hypothetical protein
MKEIMENVLFVKKLKTNGRQITLFQFLKVVAVVY